MSALLDLFKRQEDCRDAAVALLSDIEPFVSIKGFIWKLQSRDDLKRIVTRMLEIIEHICGYIITGAKSGLLSKYFRNIRAQVQLIVDKIENLLCSAAYMKEVGEFKTQFTALKDQFDRSVGIATLDNSEATRASWQDAAARPPV